MLKTILLYDNDFEGLDDFDKISFMDYFMQKVDIQSIDEKNLKRFLQNIYEKEKLPYIKKQALEVFSVLTLAGKISHSSMIVFLEEIENTEDYYILTSKINKLFLYYNGETKIEKEIESLFQHQNTEVVSTAFYYYGLISFFKGNQDEDIDILKRNLFEAKRYFHYSLNTLENRVDAHFFAEVTEFLLALLSNNAAQAGEILSRLTQILWHRQIAEISNKINQFELKIFHSLNILLSIVQKVSSQVDWLQIKDELDELYYLSYELLNIQIADTFRKNHVIQEYILATNKHIIQPLYHTNLFAIKARIAKYIRETADNNVKLFFQDIYNNLDIETKKKSDSRVFITYISKRHPNIGITDIHQDVQTVLEDPNSPTIALFNLMEKYSLIDLQRVESFAGNPVCDEILERLKREIEGKLPDYPKEKLSIFLITLADIIQYVYRTCTEPKSLFPELYDPKHAKGRTEHIFQNSVYRTLRQGKNMDNYTIEPNGLIGGGRIDLVYTNQNLRFPIEVKKTSTKVDIESIKKNYLAQAQTYVHSNHQLGIFIIFDLTEKTKKQSPMNDIRSLFHVLHLKPYYDIPDKYPDHVVAIIVPGNKQSPSNTSTYT